MDKNTAYCIFLLLLAAGTLPVLGQVQKDTTALSEIILHASPIVNSIQNTAAAVSFVSRKDLDKSDGVILTSTLNKIPGVSMQQGSLNTNRITIRGIGARSQYGTSKVKAYFEDIPLTSGEGETVLEDIDLESIGSIEIIKGPNSTSFGSGLGGVIHLFARAAPRGESFAKSVTTYGSFGLLKQTLSAGYSDAKSNLLASYSHLQSEGFRANSAYDRNTFNLHGKQQLSSKGSLSYFGIFTRLKAFIPSSLNENDFRNQPEKAAATWLAAKGNESSDKFVMGVGYQHRFSEKWSSKTSLFSTFRKANEDRPFDILKEQTRSLGFRSTLNYKAHIFSLPFETSLGTELLADKYEFSLFKNEYLSQPGQGSLTGAEFSELLQHRNYINYFVQLELQLSKKWSLESGLALNTTRYSLKDVFRNDDLQQEAADSFGSIWSPRVGLSYQVAEGKNIYCSISKGFSVPAVAETLTPEGTINTTLKPEIGWNYEVGFKGNWLNHTLYTELAVYRTAITNLLVARRTSDDQYVGINAGESSHVGVEFAVNYQLVKTSRWQMTPYFSGTITHFTFRDFVDGGADYSGNTLTGVPKAQWNGGLAIRTASGFSLDASFLHVGTLAINDQNSRYSDPYSLLDIKAGYTFTLFQFLKTAVSTGINNATNSHYAASILPNAVGFGTVAPRYYYPGNPRNFYGALSVAYVFL